MIFTFCIFIDISAITIDLKSAVEWDTTLGHTYQIESSENGISWTPLSSERPGNNKKHVHILSTFPIGTNYRIRETIPGNIVPNTTVPNNDFELESLSNWSKYGSPQPSRSIISKNGSYSARLYLNKDANTSLESKIVSSRIDGISEGESYTLGFWVNIAQSGVSLVTEYQVDWHGDSNISTGLIHFNVSDDGWQNINIPNIIAPIGANQATVTFRVSIGSINGEKAEVLIDDVVFSSGSKTPDQTLFHDNISPQRIAEIRYSNR